MPEGAPRRARRARLGRRGRGLAGAGALSTTITGGGRRAAVTGGRRAAVSAAVAAVLLVLLAGCGGSQADVDDVLPPAAAPSLGTPAPATPPAGATTPPALVPAAGARFPLTGEPASDPAVASRPASAVALPLGSTPVTGLGAADLVVHEAGSAAQSRVLAYFHSRDAERIGPVGPTRPVDAKLLPITGGLFSFNGGKFGAVRQIEKSAATVDLNAITTPSVYTRTAAGLYTSTGALQAQRTPETGPPPVLLAYGEPGQPPSATAQPATRAVVALPGSPEDVYDYDPTTKRWRRTAGIGSGTDGGPVAVANVVVQTVEFRPVPDSTEVTASVFGRGDAVVLTGDRVVRGTWSKPGAATTTNYLDSAGIPVRLAPGPTWVLLAPTGSTTSTT